MSKKFGIEELEVDRTPGCRDSETRHYWFDTEAARDASMKQLEDMQRELRGGYVTKHYQPITR